MNVAGPILSIIKSTFPPHKLSSQFPELLKEKSAPYVSANFLLFSTLDVTLTFAPIAFANNMANVATPPPIPGIKTCSPHFNLPFVKSALYAVSADKAKTPDSSQVRYDGFPTTFSAGTITYSANVPSFGPPNTSGNSGTSAIFSHPILGLIITSACNKSAETPSPISVTIPAPSDPITNGRSISFLLFIINKSL
ncbi:hypothetical protein BN2127_JRS10_04866 [Bacillus subtilis]|nr:hypothetical protein BN2127_JRS10_04866 [Bacillus subtilis]